MPDSYGRPLCSSPRFRWDTSHAAPIVTNTNETPAKAKPMMYQIPINRTPFERRAERGDIGPGNPRNVRGRHASSALKPASFYQRGPSRRVRAASGRIGGGGGRSGRSATTHDLSGPGGAHAALVGRGAGRAERACRFTPRSPAAAVRRPTTSLGGATNASQ